MFINEDICIYIIGTHMFLCIYLFTAPLSGAEEPASTAAAPPPVRQATRFGFGGMISPRDFQWGASKVLGSVYMAPLKGKGLYQAIVEVFLALGFPIWAPRMGPYGPLLSFEGSEVWAPVL